MSKRTVPDVKEILIVFAIVAVLVLCLTPPAGAAALTPYDTLKVGPIDSAKWDKYEYARIIEDVGDGTRMLRLGVRSGSGTTGPVTSSVFFPRNNAIEKVSVMIAPLTGQFFTSGGAKAMAMVGGRFYNNGAPGGAPGSCLGDVLAQVGIMNPDGSPDPKIMWSVVKYTSADCSATEVLGSGVLSNAVVTGTASVAWSGSWSTTFTWDDGDTLSTAVFTDSAIPQAVHTFYKGLHVKVKDNTGLDAYVFARFGNLYFNDVEQFYSTEQAPDSIDTTFWNNNPELVREIDPVSQHLALLARGTVNSTTYTETNLPIASPESVGAIQATVTAAELEITATATANSFVYVGGRFFNDGTGYLPGAKAYEGDIAAFVKLQVTSDGQAFVGKWKVARCTGDAADEMETLTEGISSKPIVLNTPYKLSVAWDGTKFTLIGNSKTVSYTPPITVTANATVAVMPYKGLGAVINEAGVEGKAVGYFTDVMTGPGLEFLKADVQGMGSVRSGPAGIICGNGGVACSKAFAHGKMVTLTAKAGTGWAFEKWTYITGSGTCTTKTSCQVAMNEAKEIQASFIKQPTIAVSPAGRKTFPNTKVTATKPASAIFTVMNRTTKGMAPLTVSSITLDAAAQVDGDFTIPADSDFCSNPPNASVQPNKNCKFKVLFQPKTQGLKTATLTIASDDPSSPSMEISLSGNGMP